MHSCLGNLTSKTEMASHVVVRFAKLVVCEETTERVIKHADGLLKRCGIIVENMLVLIKTISNSDSSMCLVPTSGVATGNEEQAEKQICKMTNRLHKSGIDFDFACKGSKNI